MYCRNCGTPLDAFSSVCSHCGCSKESGSSFCAKCGQPTAPNASFCQDCGECLRPSVSMTPHEATYANKSKLAAGLLGIFLGGFGLHNFYLGYTAKALAQLLLTLLTCGTLSIISWIWGFVEGILILIGTISKDGSGSPLRG